MKHFIPIQYSLKKKCSAFLFVGLLFFSLHDETRGEVLDDSTWKRIETKHTIIQYQLIEDLVKFDDKIKYRKERWSLKRLFSNSETETLFEKITEKVDLLFERVQTILDMRMRMKKVTINIYRNRAQLYNAYTHIYKKQRHIRAWYTYEYHTIYVNLEDVHEGIVAHEMAHSIIDYYLLVRPPRATAEILARYVDSHLFE
ncbi:MAG: hypothetical protein SVW57_01780 [Thermodesulfobacteriota bacterium]|nr:hypothetical protein [Thermodesulfobacteriota bacterium]